MPKVNLDKPLKLVWCSPHPIHYNAYLYDKLAKSVDISLQVVYFTKGLAKYPWKAELKQDHYPVYYLNKFLKIDWRFVKKRIFANNELLVIAGWNEPTMLLLMLWFSCTGRPFVLYSDTPDIKPRSGINQWFRKIILDFAFKNTYRFLVTGEQGVKHAKLIGVPHRIIINFPFATNIDYFVPLNSVFKKNNFIQFISSGRLDNAHKAYNITIEAFSLLKEKHPYYNFHYSIAGEGPDKKKIMDLIKKKGLANEVSLLGWLESTDLLSFYQAGDVFIHSSHFDPFPNAVLEAMACGLPVIGSNAAGSVVDRVENEKNGYIHRDDDVGDLYEKLLLICQQSIETRRLMGRNARAVAENWNVSYHIKIIESIIQEYKNK